MQQQTLFCAGSDSRNIAQSAVHSRLAAKLPVEGNTKAVSLVARTLKQFQGLRVAVQEHRIRVPYPDHFFQPLGQAYYGHLVLYPKLADGLPCEIELPCTTVYHHQLRQIFGSLVKHAGIAPVNDFLHGGVVIGANDSLDLKTPVILLAGLGIAEHDARRHRIGPLKVGIVKALYMAWQLLHAQRLAQLLHHALPESVRVGVLTLLQGIEMELFCVLGAEFEQRELVAASGDGEADRVQFYVGKERHHYFTRELSELGFYLRYEAAEHRRLLLFDLHLEAQVETLDDGSSPDSQEVAEGIGTVENQREHIQVTLSRGSDDGLGIMLLEGFDALLAELGRLEIKRLRGFQHRCFILSDNLAHTSFKQMHYLFDPGVVLLLRDLAYAAAPAAAYVIIEARAVFAPQDGIGVNLETATAERPVAAEELQQASGMQYRTVGAEVPGTILLDPARKVHPRESMDKSWSP